MSERETFFKALWVTHWRCLHSSVSQFWYNQYFSPVNCKQNLAWKKIIIPKILVTPMQVCLKLKLQYGSTEMKKEKNTSCQEFLFYQNDLISHRKSLVKFLLLGITQCSKYLRNRSVETICLTMCKFSRRGRRLRPLSGEKKKESLADKKQKSCRL